MERKSVLEAVITPKLHGYLFFKGVLCGGMFCPPQLLICDDDTKKKVDIYFRAAQRTYFYDVGQNALAWLNRFEVDQLDDSYLYFLSFPQSRDVGISYNYTSDNLLQGLGPVVGAAVIGGVSK